ncbi:MAG TPA: PfkB family carbohydrate kinase [Myxococcota bacterium]|nr:PfkB family carbohydrate kinase [Myxococcota bacterium]HRY94276.1 PfkB family carbohydrate kinase [Myxococcota bacterium]HSA21403.1 PfkB family carbohydrate kinase [Myxococcota bacterium]
MLAASLSPALQRILVLARLVPGEVNRLGAAHACASGKALNAARAWRAVGEPGRVLVPLGGPAGEVLRAELARLGIGLACVPARGPTRVCTTLVEEEAGRVTELVEEAAPLGAEELAAFAAAFAAEAQAGEPVVLTGSLPRGAPADFYLARCREARGPVVLDARGPELLAALPARPRVAKPNRAELGRTVGRALAGEAELWRAMRELRDAGAQAVLVSDGPGPALLLDGPRRLRLHPPALRPLNPIGSGDCLAAGLALGLARGLGLPESARLGLALAAANAEVLLPAGFSPARAAALEPMIRLEEV